MEDRGHFVELDTFILAARAFARNTLPRPAAGALGVGAHEGTGDGSLSCLSCLAGASAASHAGPSRPRIDDNTSTAAFGSGGQRRKPFDCATADNGTCSDAQPAQEETVGASHVLVAYAGACAANQAIKLRPRRRRRSAPEGVLVRAKRATTSPKLADPSGVSIGIR